MPEISVERLRWMRNRFIEVLQRTEEMSEDLFLIREELNRVVDAIGEALPEEEEQ
jgi:hypothetical protein